jgi:hypothetical protein
MLSGVAALLLLTTGARDARGEEAREGAPMGAQEHSLGLSVTTSGRVIIIPEVLLSNVYSDYKWQANGGGALSVGLTGLTKAGFIEPQLHVAFGGLALPAGNFKELGAPAYETFFLDADLQVLTLMARARFDWTAWRGLHLGATAGAGLWVFFGSVQGNETLPGCTEPVSACGHWDQVGTHDLIIVTGGQELRLSEISGAVVPAVSLEFHIGYEIVKNWQAGIEGGVVNLLPFGGAWLRWEFGL